MAETINVKKGKGKGVVAIIIIVIIVIVAIATISSGMYTIDATQRGILIRFGRVIENNIGPGLKFKIPYVDEVEIVDVSSKKIEFGYKTTKADLERSQYQKDTDVSRMLTGDLNIADVEWSIQYYVEDPYKYVFKIRKADDTLRDLSEALMRRFIGNMRLLEGIITTSEEGATDRLQEDFKEELQNALDNLETGIKITEVYIQNLKNADDPRVDQAFSSVVSAEQEQKTIIEQAEEEYKKTVEEIDGEYQRIKEEAEGYKAERINKAQGDVAKFVALFNEYKNYPEITKKRMYIETVTKLYSEMEKLTIIDSDVVDKSLPLYNIQQGGR